MSAETPEDAAHAIAVQNALRVQVSLNDDYQPPRFVAGVDVGYDPALNISRAAAVLLDWPDMRVIKSAVAEDTTPFPYIPGLLSFREVPAILQALENLNHAPDLLFVDGHGVAHPRGLGIAAHIGVVTGLPTLGVAKKKLCGHYETLPDTPGAHTPLVYKNQRVGTVLRSKARCNPLYISAGHRMTQDSALSFAMQALRSYRLPEPTRLADRLSKKDGRLPGLV